MIGYLDTPSGISGDMFLGCLVDGGWPIERLRDTLKCLSLPDGSWDVQAKRVTRGALAATLVDVCVDEPGDRHRHLGTIRKIIDGADLPAAVKERSVSTFERLAQAEAKVHGTSVEKVHFHEVGALDAIVDIVGTAAGLRVCPAARRRLDRVRARGHTPARPGDARAARRGRRAHVPRARTR
jgi:uncharacterized protein (DUF111 family)